MAAARGGLFQRRRRAPSLQMLLPAPRTTTLLAAVAAVVLVVVGAPGARAFSGSEHMQIGNEAYESLIDELKEHGLTKYPFQKLFIHKAAQMFTYGDLVALCADFLGDYSVKVSDGPMAALGSVDAVINTINKKPWQVNRIIRDMMGKERQVALSGGFASERLAEEHDRLILLGALYSSQASAKTSGPFNKLVEKMDTKWNAPKFFTDLLVKLPFNLALIISTSLLKSDFADLLMDNIDHFSNDPQHNSAKAYEVLHAAARKALTDLAVLPEHRLPKALLYNACGDHFLTDRFASGHILTPRGKLAQVCTYRNVQLAEKPKGKVKRLIAFFESKAGGSKATSAGDDDQQGEPINIPLGDLLGSCMHDEENRYGGHARINSDYLEVKGDDRYFNPELSSMRVAALKAVRMSIREVFTTGESIALTATPQMNTYIPLNSPLFKVEGGVLQMRYPFADLQSQEYIKMPDGEPVTDVLCWYAALKCRVLDKIPGVSALVEFLDENIGNKPVDQLNDYIRGVLENRDSQFYKLWNAVQEWLSKVIKHEKQQAPLPAGQTKYDIEEKVEKPLPAWAGSATRAALAVYDDPSLAQEAGGSADSSPAAGSSASAESSPAAGSKPPTGSSTPTGSKPTSGPGSSPSSGTGFFDPNAPGAPGVGSGTAPQPASNSLSPSRPSPPPLKRRNSV